MFSNVLSLLGIIVVTLAILTLAYWVTTLIAKNGVSRLANLGDASKGISVRQKIDLGRNKSLLVVQVHERCLLVGVTENSITTLTELTQEESQLWMKNGNDGASQLDFLQELRKKLPIQK